MLMKRERPYPRPLRRGAYRLRITVDEVKGLCPVHSKGDQIVFEDPELIVEQTDRICIWALYSLLGIAPTLCRETSPPDWVNKPKHYFQCMDATGWCVDYAGAGTVIFRVDREPVDIRTPQDWVRPEDKEQR
jgi:uncharacterized repeat protein (TIGR04076 family)